jgi:hypothetical protein
VLGQAFTSSRLIFLDFRGEVNGAAARRLFSGLTLPMARCQRSASSSVMPLDSMSSGILLINQHQVQPTQTICTIR